MQIYLNVGEWCSNGIHSGLWRNRKSLSSLSAKRMLNPCYWASFQTKQWKPLKQNWMWNIANSLYRIAFGLAWLRSTQFSLTHTQWERERERYTYRKSRIMPTIGKSAVKIHAECIMISSSQRFTNKIKLYTQNWMEWTDPCLYKNMRYQKYTHGATNGYQQLLTSSKCSKMKKYEVDFRRKTNSQRKVIHFE